MLACLAGCDTGGSSSTAESETAPPVPVAPSTSPTGISASELRRRLGANGNAQFDHVAGEIQHVDLYDSGVTDLSPLKGMQIVALGLGSLELSDLSPLEGMPLELLTAEGTPVRDLSPLAGMPLEELYLRDTQVADLSPIASAPIRKLNIVGTRVAELSAVLAMPLDTLWAGSTVIRDLTPLKGKRLESLDVEATPIEDISVLSEMRTLLRVNIAKTKVKDISALEGLKLQRLIFTPATIESGLETVRRMTSLREIGTSFETVMPANQFWEQYDRGAFAAAPSTQ